MKVTDILPGCLLNCLSSLEPATYALLRIFYADSPIPCCWTPLKAGSHQAGRDTSLMAVSFAFNHIHSSVSPAYSLDSEYVLCQQTRAFPIWSQVCCIFLSHSSSVHTADFWFHFINIQTCCSDQENKHTFSLSSLFLSFLFLLLQDIL